MNSSLLVLVFNHLSKYLVDNHPFEMYINCMDLAIKKFKTNFGRFFEEQNILNLRQEDLHFMTPILYFQETDQILINLVAGVASWKVFLRSAICGLFSFHFRWFKALKDVISTSVLRSTMTVFYFNSFLIRINSYM